MGSRIFSFTPARESTLIGSVNPNFSYLPGMPTVPQFVQKWSASGAAESSNAQSFTNDLCELIGVPKPDPSLPDESENTYVFEKRVTGRNGNTKFIDCYRRGHFILENKQGATLESAAALSVEKTQYLRSRKTGHGKRGTRSWDVAMEKARKQAENYARLLDGPEIRSGRPPFIMVADVGHSIALYADWSRAGGHYQPFPDPNNYRIPITELHREELRERLHLVWTDPLALDPARRSAKVTKKIADQLARLAKSLEQTPTLSLQGDSQAAIAKFLMRCLFTMFAEDAGLLPNKAFTKLLRLTKRQPTSFVPQLEALWEAMDTGGFSIALNIPVKRFNGGLFANSMAISLDEDQIQLLIEAAEADWREVEPAIFGTLLERALDPRERHSLGAHYTPRAYVERLVQPTILEPLRHEWESVQTAALALAEEDKIDRAISKVEGFLQRLADLRVLDPACGSGNFLYVTLELLKRLEGEVRNTLRDLGQGQISIGLTGATITPENMLGIELNPRAAAIAELVLWIGYLQWHLRSTGSVSDLGDPIIRDYHNIENRDAILAWDSTEPLLDDNGEPVTRWDGITLKVHPVTGHNVPDDTARMQVQRYLGARKAEWPQVDFIVGNPPFLGKGEKMREALGDGYVKELRSVYKKVPGSADFVMYWWHKAALALQVEKLEQFGFITTNSIWQTFNRRVIADFLEAKKPVSITYAVPDHPWVDAADGAAVRIAMTVASNGSETGMLQTIEGVETEREDGQIEVGLKSSQGKILQDLTIGANVAGAVELKYSKDTHSFGMMIRGSGFILPNEDATGLINDPAASYANVVKPYRNGKDITQKSRNSYIIDLYGLEPEEVQDLYPRVYQHVIDYVKPERDSSRDKGFREKWWLFGRTRPMLRSALKGLSRFIVTPETAKHRFFVFQDKKVIPDHMLIAIAVSDAYYLGILSSKIHTTWAFSAGGRLGYGNDSRYNKTKCLDPFPFPDSTIAQKETIRDLSERLDAHRKRQQSLHPKLTMTGMYNVLEKLRVEKALDDKERKIHERGLVGILRQLHDELDAAVEEAYGWPANLAEDEVLQRLVELNAERATEEARGLVRWLRPDYQAPEEQAVQSTLDLEQDDIPVVVVAEKRKWPKDLTKQVTTLRDLLRETGEIPLPVATIATAFKPKLSVKRQTEAGKLLEMMASLGQAELVEGGWRG